MLKRLLISLLLSWSFGATAGAVSPPGVWIGHIGAKAVVACFNDQSTGAGSGSYYFADFLAPITLTTTDEDAYWHERNDSGLWELADPANGAITGTWRRRKDASVLPIKLALVDGSDDKAACARDSFNTRLERTPKVERGEWVAFSPRRLYRPLHFARQASVEIHGPDVGLDRVNSTLRLDQSPLAINSYFEQRRESLGLYGSPDVDNQQVEITYWDDNFFAIKSSIWVVGYGRDGVAIAYSAWSSRTGEMIDLWQWIGSTADVARVPPRLMRHLLMGVKETPDCKTGYRGQGDYSLTLGPAGLVFDEEAWGSGCEKTLGIRLEDLGQYLTPIGERMIQPLLKRARR